MTKLHELVDFLDKELNISEIPDYSGALNGLQLENPGEVTKIGAAVDASLPVIDKAVSEGVDLLFVHHGMFWQGATPLTRANYSKIKKAIDGKMAIYSAHIPLDIHPHLGNNVLLAKLLEIHEPTPFFPWKGIDLGLAGSVDCSVAEMTEKLSEATGSQVHVCSSGANKIGRVGVITGGAGSEVSAVEALGIDTFITGEGPHWSYTLAEELNINVLYGGHYATETYGVKAVVELVAGRFGLKHTFIDHPTGM